MILLLVTYVKLLRFRLRILIDRKAEKIFKSPPGSTKNPPKYNGLKIRETGSTANRTSSNHPKIRQGRFQSIKFLVANLQGEEIGYKSTITLALCFLPCLCLSVSFLSLSVSLCISLSLSLSLSSQVFYKKITKKYMD